MWPTALGRRAPGAASGSLARVARGTVAGCLLTHRRTSASRAERRAAPHRRGRRVQSRRRPGRDPALLERWDQRSTSGSSSFTEHRCSLPHRYWLTGQLPCAKLPSPRAALELGRRREPRASLRGGHRWAPGPRSSRLPRSTTSTSPTVLPASRRRSAWWTAAPTPAIRWPRPRHGLDLSAACAFEPDPENFRALAAWARGRAGPRTFPLCPWPCAVGARRGRSLPVRAGCGRAGAR